MSRFLTPTLSHLTPYVPGEQPKIGQKLIKLNTNENPYPPSPRIKELLADNVDRLRLYPDPDCRTLKEAVADFYRLSTANVYVGNGSDEVLAFIFQGLCPNGAAFPDVTYGFYPVFADLYHVPCRVVPLDKDLTPDIRDYAELKETVFLANPNSPTGVYLPPSDIKALLEQDADRLVVVDEAYIDFGGESAAALIADYDNLLVVQTLSKSRQLAGGRVGLALAQPQLIGDLERLKFSFNPYSVNAQALAAATVAFRDRDWFESCRAQVMADRVWCAEQLAQRGFTLTESRANFLFAAPPAGLCGEEYYQKLRERQILIRWFSNPRISSYVRITIGRQEQLQALLDATDLILLERGLL